MITLPAKTHFATWYSYRSGGRVWKSLKTNLSKHTCCFSDFPWSQGAPTFPSSAEVQLYIKEYSTRFNLAQYVRFGHFVLSVTPSATGGWEVTFVSTAANGKRDVRQETESFDKCIIASGIFSEPYYPPTEKVKGVLDAVESGWATHSASYKDPGVYARKSVLVVGCAFSGAEIASDIAGRAARCVAATGHTSIFLPRLVVKNREQPTSQADAKEVFPQKKTAGKTISAASPAAEKHIARVDMANGVIDGGLLSANSKSAVGRPAIQSSGNPKEGRAPFTNSNNDCFNPQYIGEEKMAHRVPLDLALYSRKSRAESKIKVAPAAKKRENSRNFLIQLAGQDPGDVHKALRLETSRDTSLKVVVSDNFLNKVQDGSIELRPRLVALDVGGKKAYFSNATSEMVDYVIFCTGLRPCLSFLPPKIMSLLEFDMDDLLQPLILHHQTWNPSVPGLAFVGVYRGPYFGAMELQARWVTRMWGGMVQPPQPEASEAALAESRSVRTAQPRPQFPTDYVDMMEALADAAGVVPIQHYQASNVNPPVTNQSNSPSDAQNDQEVLAKLGETVIARVTVRASCPHDPNIDPTPAGGISRLGKETTGSESIDLIRSEDGLSQEDLEEWMWSGPLLPCHYRIRQYLLPEFSGQSSTKPLPAGVLHEEQCRANDPHLAIKVAMAELRAINIKFMECRDFSI